jgi:Topoisomerase DNA binding C4 zinc finger/HNH endonuclease
MAIVPILRSFHDIERELLRAPPVLTAKQIGFIQSPAFTRSAEWARLRYDFLRDHDACCQCCGRGPADGRKVNIDHIHPRRSHPQFALTYANLQVLCSTCNKGKGNRDRTDWRFRRRNPQAPQDPAIPPCPVCQTPMRLRSGARGAFWGCSRFPDCRGTRAATPGAAAAGQRAPRGSRGPRRRSDRPKIAKARNRRRGNRLIKPGALRQ